MLEVKNLYKSYKVGNKNYPVLHGVDVNIEKGEFVSVMGPSGSGKTTLLNCISNFIPYESGEVILNGENMEKLTEDELAIVRNEKLGFVFQDFMLLDGLTVFENICMPKIIKEDDWREMEDKANKLLDIFGIKEIADKYPVEISGGQKQKVAAARALISDPKVIFADEPTGALDYKTGKQILKLLQDTARKENMTVLIITHNGALAPMADKVIHFKNGTAEDIIINNNPVSVEEIEW